MSAKKKTATPAGKPAAKRPRRAPVNAPSCQPPEPAPFPAQPIDLPTAAYLNYRRRIEQGLPGDEVSDWLEAVKKLQSG